MPKTYVIDTCVVLSDPQAFRNFKSVIIPLAVIEELDRFKHNQDIRGRNSRLFSRTLDELREQGSLLEGVPTEKGGTIKVKSSVKSLTANLPDELNQDAADNAILAVAIECQAILVTNDNNLKIKADACGVKAESYETGRVSATDLYEGHCSTKVSGEELSLLSHQPIPVEGDFYENECLSLYSENNLNLCRLALHKHGKAHVINNFDKGVSRIVPKNREQHFALELLMDPSIPLVTISGSAGTGKTLLALAAGLALVQEQVYQRLMVARPVVPLGGKDTIGFLPGELSSKLGPWMQPIEDNLEVLLYQGKKDRKCERNPIKELEEQNLLRVEPLMYIRGRSIPNQFFLIDEAQNCSPLEIKTILTRVGEGTKVVLVGDPSQCDNPFLDETSNGLSYVIDRFKESSLSAHITLVKGERSPLSELAAKLL